MIGSLKADNFLRNNILTKPVNKSLGSGVERLSDDSPWEIKLNLLQLIVLWSVLAGAMVGVFLIGFYTGRDKGIGFALENSNIETVRLPISNNNEAESTLNATQIKLVNQNDLPTERLPETKVIDFKATSENIIESKQVVNTTQAIATETEAVNKPLTKTVDKLNSTNTDTSVSTEKTTEKKIVFTKGWYSQLAATKSKTEADSLISKMKQKKLSPNVELANIKGQTYYRILIGPFDSKILAQKASIKAKQTKTFRGEPYIKQIN